VGQKGAPNLGVWITGFLCHQGGNSQSPCSGTPKSEKAFLPLCAWQKLHGNWSPDPISGFMIWASGLSVQAIEFSGKGMAFLPASSHSHNLVSIRGRKANTWRGNNYQWTHLTWKQMVPLFLLRIRCSPTKLDSHPMKFSLEGHPPPVKDIKREIF
jgi:hypothetical protein